MEPILIPLVDTLIKIDNSPAPKNQIKKIFWLRSKLKTLNRAIKLVDKIDIVNAQMIQEFVTLLETTPDYFNKDILGAYVSKDVGLYILDFRYSVDNIIYTVGLKTSRNNITLEIKTTNASSNEVVSTTSFYVKDTLISPHEDMSPLLYRINIELVNLIKDFMRSIYYTEK